MAETLVHARVEAIRRLARRRAAGALQRALRKSSPEDIAEAVCHLTSANTRFVFAHLQGDQAGEVLLTVTEDDFELVLKNVAEDRLMVWLDEMDPDDQADLIGRLPLDRREKVLQALEPEEREQAEELMAWPDDSAGGIMSPVAFRLSEGVTCREAIAALQEQGEVEMVFYLYVENEAGQLVGVTSLRQLLLNSPNTTLEELMTPDVISVSPETDQEEVASIAARYDLLAIPVLDDTNKFLGIVTIDDVLDVLREEAAEDMLKMAGVGAELDPASSNAFRAARQRLLWLVVTLVGGVLLSEVIGGYRATLEEQVVLAGFIPVIMALGGGVGLQAATIAVRNLATGHVVLDKTALGLLWREARVGFIMGVVLSAALMAYGWIRFDNSMLGVTIGCSILAVVIGAAIIGTAIPLVLERIGVDPAVATGPFVTILIDAFAIVLYMSLATALML
jgi:magnesium transporter